MDCVLGPGFAFGAEPPPHPTPPRREIYQWPLCLHFSRALVQQSRLSREPKSLLTSRRQTELNRRRTNVQQLTCNIDLSNSCYYLFFSFVLIELKPFVLKGKVLGKFF